MASPLYVDVMNAVASTIRNLSLDGAPEVRVYVRFNEREQVEPGIHICRGAQRHGDGTMGADEIAYPAVIYMVVGNTAGDRDNEELISGWRDDLFEAFHIRREPIDDGAITKSGVTPLVCKVDFGSDFLDQHWQQRWSVNHMVIWSWIRKPRA